MGLAVRGFAAAFGRRRPDLLVVLGDRFEMHAAALAALPFKIPVAHLHGGEITVGSIDDALRHSMTKLSHLHFVATPVYGRRVLQMGEEPWRVVVSGALSLDNVRTLERPSPEELSRRFRFPATEPFLLVTFHPVTLEYERAAWQADELLAALDATGALVVFTQPNADTGGRAIEDRMARFVAERPGRAYLVPNFGAQAYLTAMAQAMAMVGNSSSGIVEAAAFGLPVVNVGSRQEGRQRGPNVLDVGYGREEVLAAIRQVTDPAFRAGLSGQSSPYGDGHAAARILRTLTRVPLDDRLVTKRFTDLPSEAGPTPTLLPLED
jgi:UDP-hydrolysing UDP-N-acetyl-D-glucosamine 2-epimerase